MKIAIIGIELQTEQSAVLREIILELEKYHMQTFICERLWSSAQCLHHDHCAQHIHFLPHWQLPDDIEMVISIGGDGAFLESVARIGTRPVPILGVNVGRLGFLADNSTSDIKAMVKDIADKNYSIDKRTVIELVDQNLFPYNYALNEVAVQKRDTSSMITIEAYADEVYINSYWADGLLIATPSGSTAYSLSAGGPIVSPSSNNFIITPVAPHSLNVRPIVLSDQVTITLKVKSRTDNFLLAMDSRSTTVPNESCITLRRAKHDVHIIKRPEHDFFNTLRNKLMWGADRRN